MDDGAWKMEERSSGGRTIAASEQWAAGDGEALSAKDRDVCTVIIILISTKSQKCVRLLQENWILADLLKKQPHCSSLCPPRRSPPRRTSRRPPRRSLRHSLRRSPRRPPRHSLHCSPRRSPSSSLRHSLRRSPWRSLRRLPPVTPKRKSGRQIFCRIAN